MFILVIFRVFSYLDVPSLCRCARVSKYWNQIALDGSNWQHVDLFSFQTDIEVIAVFVLVITNKRCTVVGSVCVCVSVLVSVGHIGEHCNNRSGYHLRWGLRDPLGIQSSGNENFGGVTWCYFYYSCLLFLFVQNIICLHY